MFERSFSFSIWRVLPMEVFMRSFNCVVVNGIFFNYIPSDGKPVNPELFLSLFFSSDVDADVVASPALQPQSSGSSTSSLSK